MIADRLVNRTTGCTTRGKQQGQAHERPWKVVRASVEGKRFQHDSIRLLSIRFLDKGLPDIQVYDRLAIFFNLWFSVWRLSLGQSAVPDLLVGLGAGHLYIVLSMPAPRSRGREVKTMIGLGDMNGVWLARTDKCNFIVIGEHLDEAKPMANKIAQVLKYGALTYFEKVATAVYFGDEQNRFTVEELGGDVHSMFDGEFLAKLAEGDKE